MFEFSRQAHILGDHIDRFAALAKGLNVELLSDPSARTLIDRVVGAGRFNRAIHEKSERAIALEEQTVLFGDALRAERRQKAENHHGMFAALAAVHHPLLGFAQLLNVDLGKQGFTCNVEHEGKTISIPLHELKVDFDGDGKIFTTSVRHGLPAGTVLLDKAFADSADHMQRRGSIGCTFKDPSGQKLDRALTSQLLWTAIAGKGKNIYPEDSAKANMLATLGIDDMEEANKYVIETVEALQQHGYNPEPLWNRVMDSAREKIAPHLETLAIVRESMIEGRREKAGAFARLNTRDPYNPKTIDNIVQFFDMQLPALSAEQKTMAHNLTKGLSR